MPRLGTAVWAELLFGPPPAQGGYFPLSLDLGEVEQESVSPDTADSLEMAPPWAPALAIFYEKSLVEVNQTM